MPLHHQHSLEKVTGITPTATSVPRITSKQSTQEPTTPSSLCRLALLRRDPALHPLLLRLHTEIYRVPPASSSLTNDLFLLVRRATFGRDRHARGTHICTVDGAQA